MGRYYNIIIGNGLTFCSQVNGADDPGALLVEMDIPVAMQHMPEADAGAYCKIWGVPLSLISQTANFTGQSIQIFGGMSDGLPLDNPSQQGLLVQGQIFPALGNWIGVDLTIDFFIKPAVGSSTQPTGNAPVVHQHLAGSPMSGAIQSSLSAAFPWATPMINISPNLVQAFDETGISQTLSQYAKTVYERSLSIMNSSSYPGVQMAVNGNTINVFDGTQQQSGPTINFTDLVGQPTWIGPGTIQFKTVMRGDINIGDTVTLPPSLATTSTAGFNYSNSQTTSLVFSGQVTIQKMRHVGNFRQPRWESWVTTFDARVSPYSSANPPAQSATPPSANPPASGPPGSPTNTGPPQNFPGQP